MKDSHKKGCDNIQLNAYIWHPLKNYNEFAEGKNVKKKEMQKETSGLKTNYSNKIK